MNNLKQYLNENYKKVIGWGTSGYYRESPSDLKIDIDFLIDSDSTKVGTLIDGKEIKSPDTLLNEEPENILIIVFSIYYKEICEKIATYGNFYTINGEELLRFFSLREITTNTVDEIIQENGVITISRNNFALYLGGTSKFIREQMELINKQGYTHIHLFWREYNIKGFTGTYFTVIRNGHELGISRIETIIIILNRVKALIIHNLIGMKLEILEPILEKVKKRIPVVYYLHDFSSICSNIKLMYNDEYFCNGYENNWKDCSTCVSNDRKNYIFDFHSKIFSEDYIQLIAPSISTKDIIQQIFNLSDDRINVISHQKFSKVYKLSQNVNKPIRIAYVGYKHKHKGWEVFKQLVEDYKGKYEFYCFGSSDEILDEVQYIDVSFIKDGEIAMTKKLKEYNIDISLLWSMWPETYSYTYYESFAAGTFVITNILSGNINDQITKNGNGIALENYNQLRMFLDDEIELKELILKNDTYITDLRRNEDEILKLIQ